MQGIHVVAMSLITLALLVTITLVVLAQAEDRIVETQDINESNVSDRTIAYNASLTMQEGISEIPGWVPLLVLVIMAGVIIGVVRSAFGGGRG